jgi:small ligand-binding sensory domain FIST
VSVRIGCGLSTASDQRLAAIEAGQQAHARSRARARTSSASLPPGAHLAAPEATLEGVHEALAPPVLVGCGAGGVVGDGREIERGTAVAVWAAALGGGRAEAFHLDVVPGPDTIAVGGLPELDEATCVVLLPDPYSFPTDLVLAELAQRAPGVPVLGGIASARTLDGNAALFLGDGLCDDGAVGVAFSGVEVLPCVSQGAAPVGPELTVTAAEGHVIRELAGRPALETLRQTIEELAPAEQVLVASGLLLGIVIDGGKPEYEQGDFLVRGVSAPTPTPAR